MVAKKKQKPPIQPVGNRTILIELEVHNQTPVEQLTKSQLLVFCASAADKIEAHLKKKFGGDADVSFSGASIIDSLGNGLVKT